MSTHDTPLFSATYDTTLELLTSYTDLLVGRKQRAFALAMALIDLVLAAVVGAVAPSAWPLSVVLLGVGAGMLWYRGQAARLSAQRVLKRLDPADLRRTVRIYPDRVELEQAGGQTYDYPASALRQVMASDALAVLAFEQEGVTVPAGALEGGTLDDVLAWARSAHDNPSEDAPATMEPQAR